MVKKFIPDFSNAEFRFVPAGKLYEPTEIEEIKKLKTIHVDTGGGEFDHHETENKNVSASSRVLDFLRQHKLEEEQTTSLVRIVDVVTEIDHFREVFWPEPDRDRYEFFLEQILDGFKTLHRDQDLRLLNFGFEALDAIYNKMQNKVRAEEEIEKGMVIDISHDADSSPSLRILALETINDETIKLAQKKGFPIVVRKDPRKGYVRIKAIPSGKVDLKKAYESLKAKDPAATWFLHVSHCMILNGSTKNPDMKPTHLSLTEVVNIVKDSLS